MMSDLKGALTRKFGPLPAWAWLAITAVSLYFWRSRGGGGGGVTSTGTGDTTAPEAPEPRDPITLSPGESVYDPNTGQLVSTAPEQQPAPEAPEATAPLLPADPEPAPANAFEDPEVTSAKAPSAAPAKKLGPVNRARAAVLTGKVGRVNRQRLRRYGYSDAQIDYHAKRKTALGTPASKKKAKPKPQHKPSTPVKHPTSAKSKPRAGGTHKPPTHRPRPKPKPAGSHHATRPRSKPAAPPPPKARARSVASARPVTRQRPAPSHTTPRTKSKSKGRNKR